MDSGTAVNFKQHYFASLRVWDFAEKKLAAHKLNQAIKRVNCALSEVSGQGQEVKVILGLPHTHLFDMWAYIATLRTRVVAAHQ